MRKKILAANWKMNLNFARAMALVDAVIHGLDDSLNTEVVFAPPFVYLHEVLLHVQRHSNLSLASQNCSEHSGGAFTGEISASMLGSIGVDYVIVGHSERRIQFHESDDVLAEKVNRAIENFLIPIFCCGETSSDRDSGKHLAIVQSQLEKGLFHLPADKIRECIIAYEPVWAIGTGVNAQPEQVQEMHAAIRKILSDKFSAEIASAVPVIYGGSISAANCASIFACADVDGGLVGGASLKAQDFLDIIQLLEESIA